MKRALGKYEEYQKLQHSKLNGDSFHSELSTEVRNSLIEVLGQTVMPQSRPIRKLTSLDTHVIFQNHLEEQLPTHNQNKPFSQILQEQLNTNTNEGGN